MGTIEQSIDVAVPVRIAYDQWTQFEQFPQFMDGVQEVRQLDETHLHWVAEVAGHRKEWDAEITEQRPDERIAWKATDGTPNGGVVTFHRLDDAVTRIMVQMEHEPEGALEKAGDALGLAERRVKKDLESFRDFVEGRGDTTSGRRSEIGTEPERFSGVDTGMPGHGRGLDDTGRDRA